MPTPTRVLLIEDSEGDAQLILRELQRGDYEPTWERVDTAAALRATLMQHRWDLIICDWVMPEFSALAALALIRELGLDTTVIVVSAEVGEEVAVTAMKAGAHDVVSKNNLTRLNPAVGRELREAVARRARQETEEALRQTERKYRTLIEASDGWIWALDATGGITFTTPAVRQILGYEPAECLGRPFADFTDPVQAAAHQLAFERVMNGEAVRGYEVSLRRKDGASVIVRGNSVPFRDAQGNVIGTTGTAHDITDQKQTEEALRASQANLQAILNNSLQSFVLTDPEGRIRAFNQLASVRSEFFFLGRPLQEGEVFLDYFPEANRADVQRHLAQALTGVSVVVEHRVEGSEGSPGRWFELNFVPVYESKEHPSGVCLGLLDIDEPKKAEQALQEAHLRLSLTLEQIPLILWTTDAELRLASYCGAGLPWLGTQPSQRLGQTLADFFGTTDMDFLPIAAHRRAFGGESVRYEYEWQGHRLNVRLEPLRDGTGTIAGTIGIAEDVTEQYAAAQDRARLAAAVEQSAEVVIITDAAGVIVYMNPAAERATGYTRDELRAHGANVWNSAVPDTDTYVRMRRTLARGELWHAPQVHRRKDGSLFELESIVFPVYDASRRVVNYVGLGRDVTEQRRMEAQLRQAQKLEAVGRLAGGVAHEFNNQLTVIKGSLEFLMGHLPDGHPGQRDGQRLRHAAERSAQLVRELLTFSRQQPHETRALNLTQLVHELEPIFRLLLGEQVTLRVRTASQLPAVRADRFQIEQLLMNLVTNARDAIAPEGTAVTGDTVILETAAVELNEAAPDVVVDRTKAGQYVMLGVSDNGPGIPVDVREHIFEPFFTTKEVGKGTGLGLASVLGIVQQHRGYIACASEPGQGAAFRVYLPPEVGTPNDAEALPERAPRQGALPSGAVILVVEDDPHVREVLVRSLTELGHRVFQAGDADAALAVAQGLDHPLDLLITDIAMPGESGVQLAQRLLEQHGALRVLFISAYLPASLNVPELPGAGFLAKPFALEELQRRVDELLVT